MGKLYTGEFRCMGCGREDKITWELGQSSMHPDCPKCGSLYFKWTNYKAMFGR